ncbi:hypothetical protein CBR_g48863 [Chara braunii]|uniref:dDENN domain-containing protein n=1 Tax=Chara braunii TaxID=69332 RepID=A0A388M3P0_CHABU|nr:hypothetical protein CBR_g48863 [Chara braunii]|eukprot:GBG89156.1 hypothetical protein CBR_g48863 [Chara braunii]
MDDYPMYGLLVGFSLWGTLWRFIFPLGFWNTFLCRVETRTGTGTTPHTAEQEAKAAAILKERREKKEAKKKALLEAQAAKLKNIEEMAREKERLKKEEEAELKEVEEEEEEEIEEELLEKGRRGNRGESSESKEDLMEKKISEWVAGLTLGEDEEALMYVPRDEQEAAVREWEAEGDPLKRQVLEDEKRMEWKFRLTKERKRRMEAATEAAQELEEIRKQRDQMAVQVDLLGKVEILAENVERLAKVQEVGSHVTARLEGTERYCVGAIEGAKLTAPKEEETRPRREPVKVKFLDSYSGKKEENFDNWEANVKTYVHLQKVSPDEQVLIAIHVLKEEAASFARSLVRAANCSDDVVAYSAFTPLVDYLKLLRERFADVSRSVRASDRLQTIHSRQWRSAKALKGVMDELVAVPDHGGTDTQLVNLFYRAMPESLRGHFFEQSQQPTITYDSLSRGVVAFEAKSVSVSTFWHKDLDKGNKWKGRTISGQVKTKDSLVLTLDEGSVDEIPYDQIEATKAHQCGQDVRSQRLRKRWNASHDDELRLIFLRFFASILEGYWDFLTGTPSSVGFSKQAFLRKRSRIYNRPPEPMLETWLNSQNFQGFLEKCGHEKKPSLLDRAIEALSKGGDISQALLRPVEVPEIVTVQDSRASQSSGE